MRGCHDSDVKKPTLHDSRDEAALIAGLKHHGDSCSSRLDSTWSSIDAARARAEALNGQH